MENAKNEVVTVEEVVTMLVYQSWVSLYKTFYKDYTASLVKKLTAITLAATFMEEGYIQSQPKLMQGFRDTFNAVPLALEQLECEMDRAFDVEKCVERFIPYVRDWFKEMYDASDEKLVELNELASKGIENLTAEDWQPYEAIVRDLLR